MVSGNPIQWTAPSTWPWIVWVWALFLLAGWARPAWRWFRRHRAAAWPSAQGRIESVDVVKPKRLFVSTGFGNRSPVYAAEIAYSYSVESSIYAGHYRRDFGGEDEAWEFLREFRGKPVTVQYNPRKPADSTLSEDAVATLIQTRAPVPEAKHPASAAAVPEWVRPFLWLFAALSGLGLVISIWVHVGALAGRSFPSFLWVLHVGIFVVWFPAVIIAQRIVGNANRKDFWKVVLKGSPDWMRYMVYALLAYPTIFWIASFLRPHHGSGAGRGSDWVGFSAIWMAFYSAALAILYSAAHLQAEGFRCINGHPVSSAASYCERCGQPIMRAR